MERVRPSRFWQVRGLASSERVNEACLDLQSAGKKAKTAAKKNGGDNGGSSGGSRGGGSGGGGCPFHRSGDEEQRQARQALSDRLLTEPLDVEELAAMGDAEGCCSYYASRAALPDAQLVSGTAACCCCCRRRRRWPQSLRADGQLLTFSPLFPLSTSVFSPRSRHAAHARTIPLSRGRLRCTRVRRCSYRMPRYCMPAHALPSACPSNEAL